MTLKITPDHLRRTAIVYVRQSTPGQLRDHPESTRRQYALAEHAHTLGFARVDVIDEDLGAVGCGRDGPTRLSAPRRRTLHGLRRRSALRGGVASRTQRPRLASI